MALRLLVEPGMGIEKPYAVEHHDLGEPLGPPRRLDLPALVSELVRPTVEGVSIAGRTLRVPPNTDPERVAAELRALIVDRVRERRPNAEEHAWEHLVHTIHGIADTRSVADEDLRHSIRMALDVL